MHRPLSISVAILLLFLLPNPADAVVTGPGSATTPPGYFTPLNPSDFGAPGGTVPWAVPEGAPPPYWYDQTSPYGYGAWDSKSWSDIKGAYPEGSPYDTPVPTYGSGSGSGSAAPSAAAKALTPTISKAADLQCNPVIPSCGCGSVMTSKGCVAGKNMFNCTCSDVVAGKTILGKCVAQLNCKGLTYEGLGGKVTGVGDIGGIIGSIFKGIAPALLQKLLQQNQSQPPGGGGFFGPSTRDVASLAIRVATPPTVLSATPSAGTVPLLVSFATDKGGDGREYGINFGDGTSGIMTGSPLKATHSYTRAETFTATLTAKIVCDSTSTSTACKPVEEKIGTATIQVKTAGGVFSATPTDGAPPLGVIFTTSASGGSSYSVAFGDGTSGQMAGSPLVAYHNYPNVGTYTATLKETTGGTYGSGFYGSGGGCTQYYQVSTPTTDPCAIYIPSTSQLLGGGGGTNLTSDLLSSLTGGTGADSAFSSVFDTLSGGTPLDVGSQILSGPGGSSGGDPQAGTQSGSGTGAQKDQGGSLADQAVNLQSGTRGDIVVIDGRVTVVAGTRDAGANTEVAGFYGSDTFGGEPEGVIAKLCRTRPWAGSVVSIIIPASFFDSLCAWRGYQVGVPDPKVPVVVQQTAIKPAPTQTQTQEPTGPSIPPEVDIWAVPARVPIGSRTSIFWNTKGVTQCTISSPAGNFEEHALSGGAATVPITGATVFTISCIAQSGEPITDEVVVDLAI